MTTNTHAKWWVARAWQTNAALCLLGLGLVAATRRLIVEYDTAHHYWLGFDGVAAISLACYLGAVALLFRGRVNRYTFGILLAVGVACRLVALFPDPALSSDVYRYAWDGVVQHAGVNPYRYVPGDPALAALREPNQDLFDNMNRRDYAHTIYPPVAQVMFYLITFISPVVTAMKLAMVLFEGLTMLALALLLRYRGVRREWLVVYAWCPLVIWEIGGSGHIDSMMMAFVMLAVLFRYRRQPVLTGLFLGLAVFTKFFPLVLVPALYTRRDWKMPAMLAAVGVVGYSLYLSVGKMVFGFFGGYVEEEGIDKGTRFFPLELAQHLPGLHGLSNGVYVSFVAVVMGGLTLWAWRRATPAGAAPDAFLAPALGLTAGLMLLFSPHYPWYVAWLLPFVVLVPSLGVATYTLGLFYLCTTALAVGYGPKQFHLNEILYSAVAIAFMIEIVLRRNKLYPRPL